MVLAYILMCLHFVFMFLPPFRIQFASVFYLPKPYPGQGKHFSKNLTKLQRSSSPGFPKLLFICFITYGFQSMHTRNYHSHKIVITTFCQVLTSCVIVRTSVACFAQPLLNPGNHCLRSLRPQTPLMSTSACTLFLFCFSSCVCT